MTDNAADRKDIRRREKESRIAERARAEVVANLMSTTQGREWLWDILSNCQIFSSTFTGDPLTTAFNEGKRAMGLSLLATVLTTCPDQYITAQREANVRASTWEQRSGPQPNGRDSGSDSGDGDEAGSINDDGDWNDYDREADNASFRNH